MESHKIPWFQTTKHYLSRAHFFEMSAIPLPSPQAHPIPPSPGPHIIRGFRVIYPLVNIQKAIENDHL